MHPDVIRVPGLRASIESHQRLRNLCWGVHAIIDVAESAFWKVAEDQNEQDAVKKGLSELLLAKAAVDNAVESMQRGDLPLALRAKVEKLLALAASTNHEGEASSVRAFAEKLSQGKGMIPDPVRFTRPADDPFGLTGTFEDSLSDLFKKRGDTGGGQPTRHRHQHADLVDHHVTPPALDGPSGEPQAGRRDCLPRPRALRSASTYALHRGRIGVIDPFRCSPSWTSCSS